MRLSCLAAPLFLASSAALAAPAPQSQIEIPPEMTDPQFIHRLMSMTDALSKAFLDLRVGEIQAVAEGRPATAADRNRTVGEIARISPQELQRQIAEARPQVEAATQAFVKQLPEITRSLSQAANALERAAANMPQPLPQH
jgi:hypothetical protein